MKTVDKLDITSFLAPGKHNIINIHFNEQQFHFHTKHQVDFSHFEGKWLFCEAESGKVIYCEADSFYFGSEHFALQEFYEKLRILNQKWKNTYGDLAFPNVTICSYTHLDGSACLAYNPETKVHTIYLTLEDLESIERFQYVLGHELGHLVYDNYFADQLPKSLNKARWTSLFPWEVFTFSSISMFLGIYALLHSPYNLVVGVFSLIQVVFWGSILALTLLSFPRLINYQTEFFCDHFSFFFAGAVPTNRLGLIDSRLNKYTHPSGLWRKHLLSRFNHQNLSAWESPILKHKFFFRNANMYELTFAVFLIAYKLKLIKKFY